MTKLKASIIHNITSTCNQTSSTEISNYKIINYNCLLGAGELKSKCWTRLNLQSKHDILFSFLLICLAGLMSNLSFP